MLSTISRLEQVINGKLYHLLCACDSPLADLKEALFQFQNFVGKIEEQAKAASAQQVEVPQIASVVPDIIPAQDVPVVPEVQQEPDIKPVE